MKDDRADIKKLVYISHPSGGKQENTDKIANIMCKLYTCDEIYNKYVFVSPVHNFGHMYSMYEADYLKGLSFCTDLLKHCDIMLLCGDWKKSRGCNVERELALELHIPIIEVMDEHALESILLRKDFY